VSATGRMTCQTCGQSYYSVEARTIVADDSQRCDCGGRLQLADSLDRRDDGKDPEPPSAS
jgi:hypothetical protein